MKAGRCLVLGGGGFLGSHLAELLVQEGFPVRVFDLPGCAAGRVRPLPKEVEVMEGDFRELGTLRPALAGCETVVHLIGTTVPSTSNRNPVFDVESNLVGTLRLLEACVQNSVGRVIFSSSGGTVYGPARALPIPETHPTEPRSSYGITKLACEKYLALFHHLHGLDYTILRIGNAYGPGLPLKGEQGVVGVFLARIMRGEPVTVWGDGSVTRDYIYVGDVARAFRAAIGQRSPFRVFNIGTGVGTSVKQLLAVLQKVTACSTKTDYLPGRPVDIPVNVLDSSRARQHLGWQPRTSFEAGLTSTWEWLRAVDCHAE